MLCLLGIFEIQRIIYLQTQLGCANYDSPSKIWVYFPIFVTQAKT